MNISLQNLRQAVTPLFHENTFGINPSATLGVMAAANAVFLFMVDSTIKRHFINETKPRTWTKLFLTESLFAGSCAGFNYLLSKVLQVELSLASFAIITATAVSFHLLLNRLFGGQKAKAAVATPKKPTAEEQRLTTQLGAAKKSISELEGRLDRSLQEKRQLDDDLHFKTGEIGRKEQEIADLRGENDRFKSELTDLKEKARKLETSLQKAKANTKEAESFLANAMKAKSVLELQVQKGYPQHAAAMDLVKRELVAAEKEVIDLRKERDRLSAELKSSKEESQSLEASLKKIEEELKTKQTEVSKVREDLWQKDHKLEMALEDLAKQKQLTDIAQQECRGRENEVGELRSEIFDLQAKLEGLREQFSSLAPPPLPPYTEPEAADDSTTVSVDPDLLAAFKKTGESLKLDGVSLGDEEDYEYEEGYEEAYEEGQAYVEQPAAQPVTPQNTSTQPAAVAKKSSEIPRILAEMKEFETNFLASLMKCQQQREQPERQGADPENDGRIAKIIWRMRAVSTEFLESAKHNGAQATYLNSDLIDRYFLAIEEMISCPEPEKAMAVERAARQDLLLKRLVESDKSLAPMSKWINERVIGFNDVERAREIKQQMNDLTQKLGQLCAQEKKFKKMKLRISEFGKTTEYILDAPKIGLKKAEKEVVTLAPKRGSIKGGSPGVKAVITNDSKVVLEKILSFLESLPADYTVDRLHCLNQLEQTNWWKKTIKKMKEDTTLTIKLQQVKTKK